MEQQSADWYEWRSQGIGSSDVAAILGISPYQTALELYRIKVGIDQQVVDNYATYHGRKFEPKARAYFELGSSKEYQPKLFQSSQYPFMRVSLDGWNEESREILEIKCPGKETMDLAARGEIPAHYLAQIHYQIFVSDANRAMYYAFNPETEVGHEIEILPSPTFMAHMVPEVIAFWTRLQRKDPPPLSDRDWKELTPDFIPLLEMLKVQKEAKMQRDSWATRDLILKKLTHPKMKGFGVRIYPQKKLGKESFVIRFDKEEGEP